MPELLSGKVKVLGPTEASNSRYEFLDLRNAEPNLGAANVEGAVLTYDSSAPGGRLWSSVNIAGTFVQSNLAYNQANAAYEAANNRVLKSGDTMTGTLVINEPEIGLNVSSNVFVGNTVTVLNRVSSNVFVAGHFETTYAILETNANTTVSVDSFPAYYYGTVKYLIQAKSVDGVHSTELLCTQDGVSTHITEYGTVLSGPILGYFSFDIEAPNAKLNFIPENPLNNLITIKVARQGITN